MKIFLAISFIALLLLPFGTFAGHEPHHDDPLVQACGGAGNPCDFCDLMQLVSRILGFVMLRIVPSLATLLFLIGGFNWILGGGGDQEKLKRGKTILTATIVGLIIVYGAWILINSFFAWTGVAEWNGFSITRSWWKIPCN